MPQLCWVCWPSVNFWFAQFHLLFFVSILIRAVIFWITANTQFLGSEIDAQENWTRSLVVASNGVKKDVTKLIAHQETAHEFASLFFKNYKNKLGFVIRKSFLSICVIFCHKYDWKSKTDTQGSTQHSIVKLLMENTTKIRMWKERRK